jgi:hypothetical protein
MLEHRTSERGEAGKTALRERGFAHEDKKVARKIELLPVDAESELVKVETKVKPAARGPRTRKRDAPCKDVKERKAE